MLQMNPMASNASQVLTSLAHSLPPHPDFTIAGFPEYATELGGDQRQILLRAASAIALSQEGFNPVVAAIVIGHADKALRKAVSERASFEHDISQKRATAAAGSLVHELITQSFGAHYAKTFRTLALGVGNTKALFANAANEMEMRQNRRVEIYLVTVCHGRRGCGTKLT
jgi:flagellar motor protein MotB